MYVRRADLGDAEQTRSPREKPRVWRFVQTVEDVPGQRPDYALRAIAHPEGDSMTEQPGDRSSERAASSTEYHRSDALAEPLKRAAAALRRAEVPFMLCGSMACWVRGGPEPFTKDVDFCVKPEDADRALDSLADIGMTTERPPEGWLYKAWDDEILVDLLFAPANVPVGDVVLQRSDELIVLSVPMQVAA